MRWHIFFKYAASFLVASEGIANTSIWLSQIDKLTNFWEDDVTLSQGPRMCDIQSNCVLAMEHIPQLLLSFRKITNSTARYIKKFPSTQKEKNCVIVVSRNVLCFGVSRNFTTLYYKYIEVMCNGRMSWQKSCDMTYLVAQTFLTACCGHLRTPTYTIAQCKVFYMNVEY